MRSVPSLRVLFTALFTACCVVPALVAGLPGEGTLATFQELDPYPAYAMDYQGDYALEAILAAGAPSAREVRKILAKPLALGARREPAPMPVGMACTGFTTRSETGDCLFGHNEDWTKRAYLVLTTRPARGYASLSVVDVGGLPTKGPERRERLLTSPLFPLAGVNEKGLAVATYTVPVCEPPQGQGKVSLYWPVVLRLLLDRSATLDEALAQLEACHVSFSDGNRLQFLIGDAQGRSAVVEWIDRKRVVLRKDKPWQTVTNFMLHGRSKDQPVSCWRYRKAEALLQAGAGAGAGAMPEDLAAEVLRQVAEPEATQFSVLFNQTRRTLRITFGWQGARVYRFGLD